MEVRSLGGEFGYLSSKEELWKRIGDVVTLAFWW